MRDGKCGMVKDWRWISKSRGRALGKGEVLDRVFPGHTLTSTSRPQGLTCTLDRLKLHLLSLPPLKFIPIPTPPDPIVRTRVIASFVWIAFRKLEIDKNSYESEEMQRTPTCSMCSKCSAHLSERLETSTEVILNGQAVKKLRVTREPTTRFSSLMRRCHLRCLPGLHAPQTRNFQAFSPAAVQPDPALIQNSFTFTVGHRTPTPTNLV
ncbi:hypothetical protein BDP27DRAFT_1322222 [Rhodocollybia butyracea]|uniref:Uncharacterized protein n=1 Tax=Rhodocollybia butyracea TaxID=206335 RepID=A0A9P5PSI8_9AGAR|nr:hypothetical protein BDP27DRAFT_1322222 [Rhodocollybia butyracea]